MYIIRNGHQLETKVYRKPTDTGLLLHHQSHVDVKYKRALVKTMLDRAYRLSSSSQHFTGECENLKLMFSNLRYPESLTGPIFAKFIASKTTEQQPSIVKENPARIVLPFKDQISADAVRKQLKELSNLTGKPIQPVFTSQKIGEKIKRQENKPKIVNQQCVVYHFKCDLCDADYVGCARRHLHQRLIEHKRSAIGKHLNDEHNAPTDTLEEQFTILRKCKNKFDCLIYEMFFIKKLKPKLNTQSDSIRAKLFT